MYFTNGDHRAFESLMQDKPGDHYDSGVDGALPTANRLEWLISANDIVKGLFSYKNKPLPFMKTTYWGDVGTIHRHLNISPIRAVFRFVKTALLC